MSLGDSEKHMMARMKIAIDVRSASGEKAGKGWYTFNIVRHLLQMDQANQYLLYSKDGVAGLDGFKNAEMRLIKGGGFAWHLRTARDIKKEQCDVFFAPSSYIIPALLPSSIKTVIAVHDLVAFLFPDIHQKKAVFVEKLFFKMALRKAAHICAVSENTRRDLVEQFGVDSGRITTVYCGADEGFKPLEKDSLRGFAEQTNLPEKFFLAVGTLEPRKNYLNLIRAFKHVHHEYPHCHLVIVGKHGWDYEEIYELINKFYLGTHVHLLGYLSGKSLVGLYNLAAALVFPSYYEGFGMPVLEAMQCGCPVIASYSSSMPEVSGEAALLVNPESVDQITGAMMQVLKNEELREKLHGKGLLQARKFSWEKSAEKLKKILAF